MSAREELAAAASSVEGVNVSAKWRQTTTPGEGWIRWVRRLPDESGFSRVDEWEICLVMPQPAAAQESLVDTVVDQVIDALEAARVWTWDQVYTETMTYDAGGALVPFLIFAGSRVRDETE